MKKYNYRGWNIIIKQRKGYYIAVAKGISHEMKQQKPYYKSLPKTMKGIEGQVDFWEAKLPFGTYTWSDVKKGWI